MVVDLTWLSSTVDVPLWGVLVLAGFQRVTKLLGDARERRRERKRDARRKAARGGRR
ncbi:MULTISPECIES: hypothetical protein [unclassified Haloferax]|uniref:hypothetical protein n=1 Tax=unclassified Haloferax TaxID=2625095 RepID=UPI002875237F|nr:MULTISPECIES: hypothetical protein [unclassified Haloferax]MDS0243955.1 hypothetical protein [Haloferax sp. S2CR25]MDS0447076.1 hypothetical protein [Haloferax sp. S2CR25-2]